MVLLRNARLIVFIICLAVITIVPAAAGDPYIDDIVSAVSLMQRGDYDKAVQEINGALTKRSGNPLAHLALGVVFLNTKQPGQAFKQFTAAHSISKDHPLALYGFGLYYLASNKPDLAEKYFRKAGASGEYDTAPTLAYLEALSGRYFDGQSVNPLLQQIAAHGLFKKGNLQGARAIIEPVAREWKGFEEEPGAVVTFDPAKPVVLAERKLSKPYKSPSQAEPKLKKVSGKVTLRADLTRAQGIAYVLFYIDGSLIGMVNHSPYECVWDTTRFANAPHTVKIEGHMQNGVVISEKSMRVTVDNPGALTAEGIEPEEVKRAEAKLWDILKLKPSKKLAYYTLAKCYKAAKDEKNALIAMERTVGMDPDFRDAKSLLIKWYSPPREYREVRRANIRQKLAAITFDDGPNVGTGRVLDVLAQKGVKATFFVVGGMAEANPDILKRMAAEGHQLENHTYSHRNLRLLPDLEIEKELVRTSAVIREITGQSSKFFRPPGGNKNGYLHRSAGKYGYSSVFWTINCVNNEGTKPENIIRQVTSEVVPGTIRLMHNVEEVTLTALPKVVDVLREKGYKLVTLSEMLAAE